MPLIKGRDNSRIASKMRGAAIKSQIKKDGASHVEAEMHEGNPQPQALAIAYSVKRRAKKAKGGKVIEAQPDRQIHQKRYEIGKETLSAEEHKNKAKELKQSLHANLHPEKVKTRQAKIDYHEKEANRVYNAKGGRVTRHDNEKGIHPESYSHDKPGKSDRGEVIRMTQSPSFPKRIKAQGKEDIKKEHEIIMREMPNPKLKGLAEGGRVQSTSIKRPSMVPSNAFSARLRDEEDHLEQSAAPAPYDEQPPQQYNEEGPDRQGPSVHMEAPHNDEQEKAYAEGGHVEDSMDQPSDEAQEEHHNSIAAAIMAKKDREMRMNSDSDIDDVVMMALGGEILEDDQAPNSHESIYSDDSDQADLSRNADEDANEEDQLSFNALRKENYSESEGLQQLDSPDDSNLHGDSEESESENKHDKISAMRSRMSKRRQFSR